MSAFPITRLRRMRRTGALRSLVRETRLDLDDFVQPLFVGPDTRANAELPPMGRFSVDDLSRRGRGARAPRRPAVILFGIPEEKDEEGSGAWDDDGVVQRALRELRPRFPELLLLTDVCLCEYTSHGHCGVIRDGEVANDESLELIARTAVSHVEAGADAVCPSDMMDGRVACGPRAAARHADPRVLGEVRLRVLRPVPRGGGVGAVASATGARTRWIPRTCARRCASASSISPRAPT